MLLAIASTLRLRHEKYYQSGQLNTKYSTHKEGRYTSEKSGLIYHHQKRKQHQGQRNTLSFHIARFWFEKKIQSLLMGQAFIYFLTQYW